MNYRKRSIFLCIFIGSVLLSAQTITDIKVQGLRYEIENLKNINQDLLREYDSLKNLNNSNLPRGYCVRLNGRFVGNNSATYRIIRDQVGGKHIYSIASFSKASDAFRMAAALRKLKLGVAEVVYRGDSPPISSQQSANILEIED